MTRTTTRDIDEHDNDDEEELSRSSSTVDSTILESGSFVDGEAEKCKEVHTERRQRFLLAVYGEFFGTFVFFVPIFGVMANSSLNNWDSATSTLFAALGTGFVAVPLIFSFSSLSGAQFNPAISFALWLTKKQSTRKFIAFSIAQYLATLLSLLVVWGNFAAVDEDVWRALALHPPPRAHRGNVFFSEMTCTFILTFVALAMAFEEAEHVKPSRTSFSLLSSSSSSSSLPAEEDEDAVIVYSSTPQSKTGFAPFGIGFLLVAIILFGGSSHAGMNPARYLAPAIFANDWTHWQEYLLGEYAGAALAALVVVYGPQSFKRPQKQ